MLLRASAVITVDLSGSYLILLPLGIEEAEKKGVNRLVYLSGY